MTRGGRLATSTAEPYDGLELVRLTLPRRVYAQEHLNWVASVVAHVLARASEIPGLRFTYEPEHLRFFQARFEPVGGALFRETPAFPEWELEEA